MERPLEQTIKGQAYQTGRRVCIRIVTFEACSGFTHVTTRRIAQPPKGNLCHEAPNAGHAQKLL